MKLKILFSTAIICLLACKSVFAGEIKILEASYGAKDKSVDVTDKIKQLALTFGEKPDFIVITPTNSLVKKDPARGISKKLTVKYAEDGAEKTKVIAERKTDYIGSGIKLTKEFSLIKAFYGGKNKWNNVTPRVEKMISKQGEQEVNNSSMGGDPIHGTGKKLIIYYSKDNKIFSKFVGEKTKFDFSSLATQPEAK